MNFSVRPNNQLAISVLRGIDKLLTNAAILVAQDAQSTQDDYNTWQDAMDSARNAYSYWLRIYGEDEG